MVATAAKPSYFPRKTKRAASSRSATLESSTPRPKKTRTTMTHSRSTTTRTWTWMKVGVEPLAKLKLVCLLWLILFDMFPALTCRPSACRDLRTQRKCHQLHLIRKFRESSDLALEGTDYAGTDLCSEELARQICLFANDAQYGTLLSEAGSSRRMC